MRLIGTKDAQRRLSAERGRSFIGKVRFLPYAKTVLTYAVRMTEPFEVETLEGLHTGKAGDWLAIGPAGEMYPIDATVFESSYAAAPAEAREED